MIDCTNVLTGAVYVAAVLVVANVANAYMNRPFRRGGERKMPGMFATICEECEFYSGVVFFPTCLTDATHSYDAVSGQRRVDPGVPCDEKNHGDCSDFRLKDVCQPAPKD